jgi:hypothetical protein
MAARSVIGIGPRSIDLLPLARLGLLSSVLNYEGHPFAAPTDSLTGSLTGSSTGSLADSPEVWTLESGRGHRRNHWRPADVAEVAHALRTAIDARGEHPVVVLPYSPNRQQEAVLARCRPTVRSAANSRDILDGLHDKILVRAALRGIGVPVPASLAVHRSDPRTADAVAELGLPFVAQTRSGFAGKGTYLIRSPADLDAALAEKPAVEQWLLSAYVGECTVNFTAVVDGRGRVRVAPPAVQLGDLAAPNGFGNYGGNDFAAARDIDPAVLRLGERWTARIGSWLAGRGFLGMFGVDYVVADGALDAIEVNPRMQASSALLGEIELANGLLPTAVRHLAAFLDDEADDEADDEIDDEETVCEQVGAAQLALREHGGSRLVARAPRPGRYAVVDGRLVFAGPADGLLECGAHEVVVVGVPAEDTLLSNGATLARVITRERLVDATGTLLPTAHALSDAVRAAFDLQSPHQRHQRPMALLGRVT